MKTQIEQLIKDQINQENDYIREHEQIKSILIPLAGQPITGRVLNKKRLSSFDNDNGYTFNFVFKYGMFHIEGKYSHLIGYESEPIIAIDKNDNSRGFNYFDACYGSAARERIEQLKKLDVDKFVSILEQINISFENICTMFGDLERNHLGSFYNPVYYSALNLIKSDNDPKHTDIKLTNFYYLRK